MVLSQGAYPKLKMPHIFLRVLEYPVLISFIRALDLEATFLVPELSL